MGFLVFLHLTTSFQIVKRNELFIHLVQQCCNFVPWEYLSIEWNYKLRETSKSINSSLKKKNLELELCVSVKQELWYLILLKLMSLGKPIILNQMPPISISSLYCWSFLRQAQFRYRKWKLQRICYLIQGCYIYLFMHRQRLRKKSAISHKLMVNCG